MFSMLIAIPDPMDIGIPPNSISGDTGISVSLVSISSHLGISSYLYKNLITPLKFHLPSSNINLSIYSRPFFENQESSFL